MAGRSIVQRTKARANLASRRFHSMIADGTIVIETQGRVTGQVNGLAVIKAGMLTYGFPARITATIAPGNAGIIDIEGSSALSGQIHTKGFHILGGLLRHLLHTDHALAFSASLLQRICPPAPLWLCGRAWCSLKDQTEDVQDFLRTCDTATRCLAQRRSTQELQRL